MTDEHGLPDHGTASRYYHHGCRCDLCRAEKNRQAWGPVMTSSERAEQIRDKALKAVADRITALGAEFHPAAIPIVAANVAMHVMADELLDDISDPSITILGHVARLTAWGSGEQRGEAQEAPTIGVGDPLREAAMWVVLNWDAERTQHGSMPALRQALGLPGERPTREEAERRINERIGITEAER